MSHPKIERKSELAPRARVTVAVVTYRSKIELPDCIESTLGSGVPLKLVIIDNDSKDGTFEMAEQWARSDPRVLAVASGGNIGLAAGNNIVLRYVDSDYVLMLNPDTAFKPGALATLVEMMDRDPSIGAIGPKCVYEDGTAHTSYHRGWNFWHLFVWRVIPYSLTRKLYDKYARYRESEVGFISGACLMARSQVFKDIGGYDPAYFLTVEDAADLCLRIRQRGYRILFTPRAEITHLCGRSGASVPYLSTLEGYKGDLYHFQKWHGKGGGYLAFAIVLFACLSKTAVSLLKVMVRRRQVDRQNLTIYCRILLKLLSRGSRIAYSSER